MCIEINMGKIRVTYVFILAKNVVFTLCFGVTHFPETSVRIKFVPNSTSYILRFYEKTKALKTG